MPTYAYRCADCGHAFDIRQAFTDDALTVCPECAGRLRKQYGSVGVSFKGSGFYRNDSRAGSGSSSGSSSSGSSSSGSSSSGSSSGGSSSSTGSSQAASA
ncbi:FmdB family zinc ribbon protein [Isoptericola haloaureus]|uniref:FmdB family zinc ribbon protein n=1 Tax=Isoptericola haloaureus TaxID=1542902 RepID=A0ABU7Z4N5_9MICO